MSSPAGSAAPGAGSAPAPVGAPSGGPSGSSGSGGGGAAPEAFDYRKAFESHDKKLGDTQNELRRVMQDFGKVKEQSSRDSELLGKVREVFSPTKKEPGQDPRLAEYEQMLDYYIAQGVEAEKAGRPMPLTINNGITTYRGLIEAHQREVALNQRLQEMQSKLEQLSDPQVKINEQAYSSLDGHIKRGLDSLYGPGQTNIEQKRALFQAVGGQLGSLISKIQQEAPGQWDMLRRDPEGLQDLANRALRANIPPKALQMMAEDNLRNTEMPLSELRQAFKEAGETIKDPRERQQVQKQIREEILERMYKSGKLRLANQ